MRTGEQCLANGPEEAIEQFVRAGLLEPADLAGRLEARFSVAELKKQLRDRGLKVSGKKAELAHRLAKADPVGVEKLVRRFRALILTPEGRERAETFLEQQRQARKLAEAECLTALKERRFRDAAQLMLAHESQQVFPRVTGSTPSGYEQTLRRIFSVKPSLLKDLDSEQWEHLRIAAAMMELWGGFSLSRMAAGQFGHRATFE